MAQGYKVLQEPQFDASLHALPGPLACGEQVAAGASWILSRDPTWGEKLFEHVWLLEFNGSKLGALLVYYCFNEKNKTVHLLSMTKRQEGA